MPPSVCEDWNLYPKFIARRAYHLLYQRRFSCALKHSFQPPFAAKRVAPKTARWIIVGSWAVYILKRMPSAFLKQSKSLRFLTEISSSALFRQRFCREWGWRAVIFLFHLSSSKSPKICQKGGCNSLNVKRKLTFIKNLKNFIKKFAQYCFRPYLCTRSFKVHLG